MKVHAAYDELLLRWQLGRGHPTNPIRAKNALHMLEQLGADVQVEAISRKVSRDELQSVHSEFYVEKTLAGVNDEWQGVRPDLGDVARHMFAGTAQLVDGIISDRVRIGFAPQGAKHHAMWGYGSGFCVFNDFAYAAKALTAVGHRVLYVDLDAHHGDGVEALTALNPHVRTASVHDRTIFPGTGHANDEALQVYNYPLPKSAGDVELLGAVYDIIHRAHDWKPTALLVAIGGDGYKDDPLSTLEYTYAGYRAAASVLGSFAGAYGLPVLLGGAGGYLPHTHTPAVWAEFVATFAELYETSRESMYTTVMT